MEVWKDIDGYYGKYQVSTWGRVRNAETGRVLSLEETEKGYLKVILHDSDGKRHKHRVNRLVAIAFISNPYNLPQVNHKDGNKKNNSITNLEWTTDEINKRHQRYLKSGGYIM